MIIVIYNYDGKMLNSCLFKGIINNKVLFIKNKGVCEELNYIKKN